MKRLGTGHWLLAALLAAILAAPCIGLALREMERHEFQGALGVSALMSLKSAPIALESVRRHVAEYRRVIVRGSYDDSHQVLIRGREHRGEPGYHVITPLRVADGAFLVLRGWIGLRSGGATLLASLRETGEVTVEGFPLPAPPAAAAREIAAIDPEGTSEGDSNGDSTGDLEEEWPLRVDAPDVKDLKRRLPYPISRFVVQQLPHPDLPKAPERLPAPVFDDASHERKATAFYVAAACLAALPFAGLLLLRRRG